MSQQAQAEGFQQRAIQALEELQRRHADLAARHEAGDLPAEAFQAESQEILDQISATDALVEQAERLNTVTSRVASLQGQPQPRRPAVASAEEESRARRSDPEHLADRGRDPNVLWEDDPRRYRRALPGSRERALLNAILRPANHPARQALSREDLAYLAAPRTHLLMNPWIDQDGGFITAQELGNEVIRVRDKSTALVDQTRTIPTTAASVSFPTASVSATMSKRGKATGATVTPTSLSDLFGKTQFVPQGKDIILKVPMELVEDATFDLVGFLAQEIARISREDDETAIIQGTGAGEALGFLNGLQKLYDAGTTSVGWDGVSSFAGAAFTEDDVQVIDVQIPATSAVNASVVGPRIFEEKVRLFRTKSGGASTGEYMFKRSLEAGGPNTLNGFPLFRSEFFPDNITSGSAGDPLFALVDLNDYWYVVRSGLNVSFLAELYREENSYGYAWAKRVDGALTRYDGAIYLRRQA